MRLYALAVAVALATRVEAQARPHCNAKDAVYRAVVAATGVAPDTLYVHREIPGRENLLGHALVKSPELHADIPLAWFMTTGSGQMGVTGTFPIEKVRASQHAFYDALKRSGATEIDISSVSVAVYGDYRAKRFPEPNGRAPRLLIFPEFVREYRALSSGMANGVFAFHHCKTPRQSSPAAGSAAAEPKDRPLIQKQRCLLQVDGKTYMAGRCQYWVSKEGDVMITGRSKLYPRLGPFKQGIVVWADPDVEAAWNGPFVERHAHDSLGKLTKRGDCWVNGRAKVCVR